MRFALIGCGKIGKVHADSIAAHPRAELAWACHPRKQAADGFASEYGARASTDIAAALVTRTSMRFCRLTNPNARRHDHPRCSRRQGGAARETYRRRPLTCRRLLGANQGREPNGSRIGPADAYYLSLDDPRRGATRGACEQQIGHLDRSFVPEARAWCAASTERQISPRTRNQSEGGSGRPAACPHPTSSLSEGQGWRSSWPGLCVVMLRLARREGACSGTMTRFSAPTRRPGAAGTTPPAARASPGAHTAPPAARTQHPHRAPCAPVRAPTRSGLDPQNSRMVILI